MSPCDTCRSPGECCKMFVLSPWYGRDNWKEEATADMERRGFSYFVPVRSVPNIFGRDDVTQCFFQCTRLGEDGRCTSYEDRPTVCRIFEPRSDRLCAEFENQFRGIPVVSITA